MREVKGETNTQSSQRSGYFLSSHLAVDFFFFFSPILWQVTLWLKEVFENQPIPHYEVNPQTVEILYNLKEYSETRERDLAFLVEDTEQKAAEYEAQGELEAPVLGFITVFLSYLIDFFIKNLSPSVFKKQTSNKLSFCYGTAFTPMFSVLSFQQSTL